MLADNFNIKSSYHKYQQNLVGFKHKYFILNPFKPKDFKTFGTSSHKPKPFYSTQRNLCF